MNCPLCKHCNTSVLDTRSRAGGQKVHRRRQCDSCRHRFSSLEQYALKSAKLLHFEKLISASRVKLRKALELLGEQL
jgi:transcriptional regulator NrdR family protein